MRAGRQNLAQRLEEPQEMSCCRHGGTDAYVNLLRLWRHTQDRRSFKPDRISALRRESEHKVPPLTDKMFAIETFLGKGESVVINGVSLSVTTHSRAGPVPSGSWSSTKKTP